MPYKRLEQSQEEPAEVCESLICSINAISYLGMLYMSGHGLTKLKHNCYGKCVVKRGFRQLCKNYQCGSFSVTLKLVLKLILKLYRREPRLISDS